MLIFCAVSLASRMNCLGSRVRTTISPDFWTARNASAVLESYRFCTVSICRNTSSEIPVGWNGRKMHCFSAARCCDRHERDCFCREYKRGSVTVLLTSCLTGLESAVWQLTIFDFICKTDLSKPDKQEVNSIVILPPLVFPGFWYQKKMMVGYEMVW